MDSHRSIAFYAGDVFLLHRSEYSFRGVFNNVIKAVASTLDFLKNKASFSMLIISVLQRILRDFIALPLSFLFALL